MLFTANARIAASRSVLALGRRRRALHQSAALRKPPALDSQPASGSAPAPPPPALSPEARKAPKESGTISAVFATLSGGSLAESLPPRFLNVKRGLVQSPAHAEALQRAWTEVLSSLEGETDEIIAKGSALIPQIHYPGDDVVEHAKVQDWVDQGTLDNLKKRGAVIVKGVVEQNKALGWKQAIRDYVKLNPQTKGFPDDNPQVYELYWSKAQLAARSHPSLLNASRAMLSLFHAPSQTEERSAFSQTPPPELSVSLQNPLTYSDRLRIRLPGDSTFALGPHIDGGGVERWEDPTFRGCWSDILELKQGAIDWTSHDSWSLGPAAQRLGAKTDMYNGPGACSVFRPLQGWLSMSETKADEGTLRVLPLLTQSTAYIILRPFFKPVRPRSQFATQRDYLCADNWTFDLDDPHFPGCTLGRNIELSNDTHPHLRLDDTMTSIPKVEPGDMALWHCDLVHAVEAQHRGAPGKDSSVMYIPAIPLTRANFDYVRQQREAFEAGIPPSDFPGGEGESRHNGRGTPVDITSPIGRRAMALDAFAATSDMPDAERQLIELCNSQI